MTILDNTSMISLGQFFSRKHEQRRDIEISILYVTDLRDYERPHLLIRFCKGCTQMLAPRT